MKNKSLPLVSIIIPTYNSFDYLEKMIECVLDQSFTNWELIIVDDQSTDKTPQLIKKHTDKDDRIKFFIRDRAPKGAQTCRNIGMDRARGTFLMILDSDDLISRNCVENRVKLISNNQDVDYISFPAKSFNNEKKLPTFYGKGHTYGIGNEKTDILSSLLKANYSSIVWTNIYKASSLKRIRWDEKVKVYQDFDFALTGVLSGLKHKFSNTKEIDYYYRIGQPNTISSDFVSNEKASSTIYLFSKTLDLLKKRNDYTKRKKEFLRFVVVHFERLATDGDKSKINEYLLFLKGYYSSFVSYSLFFISKIAIIFKNSKTRKRILYLLILLRFWHKRYINSIISYLKGK